MAPDTGSDTGDEGEPSDIIEVLVFGMAMGYPSREFGVSFPSVLCCHGPVNCFSLLDRFDGACM